MRNYNRRNYNYYGNYNFRKTRQWVVYGNYNEEVGRFYTREEAIAYAKRNGGVGVYREAR